MYVCEHIYTCVYINVLLCVCVCDSVCVFAQPLLTSRMRYKLNY